MAGVAAGAIYKSSARISPGGTALPIKRVATTRPSGNTKLSGRPWSRASSRTCSSRACVPSCHTYTALVVDPVVIFFPGEYTPDVDGGSYLRLFGTSTLSKIENPHYRATNLAYFGSPKP